VILLRSETTLKKQQMEGDRSSTWQRDREMTFGTMRRIIAPTGTGNLPALPRDWIRRSSASVMTQRKIVPIQCAFPQAFNSRRHWGRDAARVGVCSVGVCWLALAGTVFAQEPERAISAIPNLDYTYSNLPTQPVGPDDLLALSVYDSPELTRTVRVDADGNIRLPMLKDPIQVRGMVPSQLESAIAKALTKGNVLVDPIVTVTIVEYQSRPVNVVGAVKTPLVFQASRPIPLLDAIARAGGMREDAGSDIVVSKQVLRDGKSVRITQTIPVRKLIDSADPTLNVMLHGGEEVLVPEALKIYVVGNVKKPGAYPVKSDEETTILQLLALSEGLTPFSAKVAYVYRRSPSGTKTEVPVPLAKIMKRQSPDVPLQANDILYIPDNNGKRLTAETLDRIAGLGSGAATDYIIWH
jgi:polysaccharide biosynthesis/export protein